MPVRRTAAVIAAKTAAGLSRRLRFGGGTALPGLIAERVDPGLVAGLASRLGQGSALVTGTNGKTTTSRLLRNVVQAAGLRPVANREGSNMMRGVAAALAEAASWEGKLRQRKKSVGVFEVDEATMPLVAREVRPRAVVFTNLFRDQLDRYGEVETVAALWRKAAAEQLGDDVTLVINADDPAVASLRDCARGPVLTFGLEDSSQGGADIEHAADARWCLRCGTELSYTTVFYAHIGHWRCPGCGNERPSPDIACTRAVQSRDALDLTIRTPSGEIALRLPLAGVYNAYNAVAAVAGAVALGVADSAIESGLATFTAAFGRQERLQVRGREVEVILAKNPSGVNQVLRTLLAQGEPLNLALLLNDDLADGRDISWIWDVDFELLRGHVRMMSLSGRRGWDLALRMKYAGVWPKAQADALAGVEPNTALALKAALDATPELGTLVVIPTYTAMLDVRNILGKWSGRGAFWEGDDR
jgi:UDP-N-acetylmuramyl tripeptide synthase